MHLTITPAFGRDYTRELDAVAAYHRGEDFILQPTGLAITKEQIAENFKDDAGGTVDVNIRFARLRKVVVVCAAPKTRAKMNQYIDVGKIPAGEDEEGNVQS